MLLKFWFILIWSLKALGLRYEVVCDRDFSTLCVFWVRLMIFVLLCNNWWLCSSPHQTIWNKQIKSWFFPLWQFHTHVDRHFLCVCFDPEVFYIWLYQNYAKCNEKCFLRSVGACLSVCEHGWVPDDRDFQLSRVRGETQWGFKTDSRHSACLSVAKIQDAFIAQQNCVVLWRSVLADQFIWHLYPRHA